MLQLSLTDEVMHLIPISGKDSLAAALVQTARDPDKDYQFLFNDAGSELPETYEWLARVEQVTGWKIQRTTETIEARLEHYGGFLPSHQQRWCTEKCKILPSDRFAGSRPVFAYYGLRADEPERKGFIPTRKNNLLPVYPLRELGLTLAHVWMIVSAKGLLPPAFHWQRLEDAVLEVLPESQWIPLEPWQRRMLFSGRSRSNCFHCFYQRLYEWLWLYEIHRDLFERARSHEKSDYTWNPDHPLSDYDDPAFRERVF